MNGFSSRNEIKKLYDSCELKDESIKLIKDLQSKEEWRDPMYLTLKELDDILIFKLRNQFNRQRVIRNHNEEYVLRRVSELAYSIDTSDQGYTDVLKIKLLSTIKGISTATASACLALVYPERYAIIDRRNWRELYDENKVTFLPNDYATYMKDLRDIASEFNLKPQVVDVAIWQRNYLKK